MTDYNENHPIIKKAIKLAGDNPRKMSEEEIKKWSEYARRVLHPTPEEKIEIERKHQESLARFNARTAERKRRIRQQYAQARIQQQPKRFFGIKIGFWF